MPSETPQWMEWVNMFARTLTAAGVLWRAFTAQKQLALALREWREKRELTGERKDQQRG